MKIIFASNNAGKIAELKVLLQDFPCEIIPQSELGVKEVPETGLTFIENAIIKARNASLQTGLPAIADDSGLEVKALMGAPGIYSARYAGGAATANDNIEKLLNNLKDVPAKERVARFYCAIVFFSQPHDCTPLICEGEWRGMILDKPQGQQGFGYDPIFFDTNEACSAAEIPLSKKNIISHRGKAFRIFLEKFKMRL